MRVLLSWSSGKDSAWALHVLRREGLAVVGLLTTVNEAFDRVAMHGTPRRLLEAQAEAVGLPLHAVSLPWPCPNEAYEARMREALARARDDGITHVAFGDLFLEDVRAYRETRTREAGLEPIFPLWDPPGGTATLARAMVAGGLEAVLACVDPRQAPAPLLGRRFDADFLDTLPPSVDPCGERGEFHTFCIRTPDFRWPVPVEVRGTVVRDGFRFADLAPVPASAPADP